jgi:hypothetical protein
MTLVHFYRHLQSVTLIMQEELNATTGFTDWYANRRSEMESHPMMKVLNYAHVETTHRQSVRPPAHVRVNICGAQPAATGHLSSIRIIRTNGTIEDLGPPPEPPQRPQVEPAPPKEATTDWRWNFRVAPENDVVTVRAEHVVKLEALVTECESRSTPHPGKEPS